MLNAKYELIAAYFVCLVLLIVNFSQRNDAVISMVILLFMTGFMIAEHRRKINYINKVKEIEESAQKFYNHDTLQFVSSVVIDNDEVIGTQYNELVRYLGRMDWHVKRNQQIINLMTMNSDSPIVILNIKGEIEYANQSFRQWVELPLLKRLTVNKIKIVKLKELMQNALVTEERKTTVFLYDTKHYQVVSNPIFDANQLFSGAVISFYDITELKKYELLQKEFFASVSHELKTPISAIKGCTELLLTGAKNDDAILDEFLHIIKDENYRMERLVQDLMLLNRYEHEQFQIQQDRVCLNEIVSQAIVDVLNVATLKHQKIKLTALTDAYVLGDSTHLKLCFLNLLTNAINYSDEKTVISVEVNVTDTDIEVLVIDEGKGIPEQDLNHIFERFYRVHKSRERHTGGTGLGLSLVATIMSAHQAEIEVSSVVDEGTTFRLIFKKA